MLPSSFFRPLMEREKRLRFAAWLEAEAEAMPAPEKPVAREVSTKVAKTRGRKPDQTPRVMAVMRMDLQNGYDLARAVEKAMEIKYKACRDTCRKARNAVLSTNVEN